MSSPTLLYCITHHFYYFKINHICSHDMNKIIQFLFCLLFLCYVFWITFDYQNTNQRKSLFLQNIKQDQCPFSKNKMFTLQKNNVHLNKNNVHFTKKLSTLTKNCPLCQKIVYFAEKRTNNNRDHSTLFDTLIVEV